MITNYQLIKLQDKFILVSDEEKVNGDECIYLTTFNRSIHHDIDNNLTKWWKIISENPDFSLLSEEDCKRIGWVDVEKLMSKWVRNPNEYLWVKKFYKEAQSLNDKMFSLEDIRKAFYKGHQVGVYLMDYKTEETFNEFIQSLQQTSWNVEVEMEQVINNQIKVIKIL